MILWPMALGFLPLLLIQCMQIIGFGLLLVCLSIRHYKHLLKWSGTSASLLIYIIFHATLITPHLLPLLLRMVLSESLTTL